jgi:hypothetical protein
MRQPVSETGDSRRYSAQENSLVERRTRSPGMYEFPGGSKLDLRIICKVFNPIQGAECRSPEEVMPEFTRVAESELRSGAKVWHNWCAEITSGRFQYQIGPVHSVLTSRRRVVQRCAQDHVLRKRE